MKLVDEIEQIKTDKKTLKSFGITMGVCFAIIAGVIFFRHKTINIYWVGAALLFATLGVLCPQVLKPAQKVWMTLALAMGWVMTRVILSILFYLVVTPIGLLARATGHHFLNLGIEGQKDSFWETHKASAEDKTRYENQY